MSHSKAYQTVVIGIRLSLSLGLTLLLCYYLPNSLNQRTPMAITNTDVTTLELPLAPPEKQKVTKPENTETKPRSANVLTPVLISLPVMSAVADTPVQVPVLAVPSLSRLSLPKIGTVIAGIRDVDQPPELLRFIQPKMPVAGRKFKQGGKVLLRLIVEADGKVREALVLEAKPENVFDSSAIEAARKWRFKPAILSGKAVTVFVDVPINFKVN
jgi:protein TonB